MACPLLTPPHTLASSISMLVGSKKKAVPQQKCRLLLPLSVTYFVGIRYVEVVILLARILITTTIILGRPSQISNFQLHRG